MLQRTAARSLLKGAASHATGHHVCTCSCGALLRSHGEGRLLPPPSTTTTIIQRRTLKSPRKAPSTRRKQERQEGFALTPQEAAKKKEHDEFMSSFHYKVIQRCKLVGICDVDGDTAIPFLNDFVELEKAQRGRTILDLAKYRDLVQRYKLTQRDVYMLCLILLKNKKNYDDRITGRKMIFTASAAGHVEATIRILSNALLGSKAQKGLLKNPEMRLAREQLQQIALKGDNYRAMVLEGKIGYELGDDEYAIKCWERALPLARAEIKEVDRLSDMGKEGREKLMILKSSRADNADLSAPWVELSAIRYERYAALFAKKDFAYLREDKKAKEALRIGCEMDDPTCHFRQAYWYGPNENNNVKHTSTWLYHMTKAAASGHSQACHKLAEWYAGSDWPYIEDEPPDEIKPTPFDTYPADSSPTRTALSSAKTLLTSWITPSAPPEPTSPDSHADTHNNAFPHLPLFHTATFPSTPTSRFRLAKAWLEFPTSRLYAPAHLLLAQILMEKTLPGTAYAPPSALQLKPSRYLYASRADYESQTEIPGRREALLREREKFPKEEPNPFYDPAAAKRSLTEVFYAISAHRIRERYLQAALDQLGRRRIPQHESGVDEVELVSERSLPKEVPAWIRKWLRFENEREMYEGQIGELEVEAKGMAEAYGWDLVDEVGGLVYKSGLGGQQGQQQGRGVVGGDEGRGRGYVGRSY